MVREYKSREIEGNFREDMEVLITKYSLKRPKEQILTIHLEATWMKLIIALLILISILPIGNCGWVITDSSKVQDWKQWTYFPDPEPCTHANLACRELEGGHTSDDQNISNRVIIDLHSENRLTPPYALRGWLDDLMQIMGVRLGRATPLLL